MHLWPARMEVARASFARCELGMSFNQKNRRVKGRAHASIFFLLWVVRLFWRTQGRLRKAVMSNDSACVLCLVFLIPHPLSSSRFLVAPSFCLCFFWTCYCYTIIFGGKRTQTPSLLSFLLSLLSFTLSHALHSWLFCPFSHFPFSLFIRSWEQKGQHWQTDQLTDWLADDQTGKLAGCEVWLKAACSGGEGRRGRTMFVQHPFSPVKPKTSALDQSKPHPYQHQHIRSSNAQNAKQRWIKEQGSKELTNTEILLW